MTTPALRDVLLELIREAGRDGITEGAMADAFGRAAPHPERMRTVLAKLALDGAAHRDEQHWKLGRARPAAAAPRSLREPVREALPSREARGLAKPAAPAKPPRPHRAVVTPAPILSATGETLYPCTRCGVAKPESGFQLTNKRTRSPSCRTCRYELIQAGKAKVQAEREQVGETRDEGARPTGPFVYDPIETPGVMLTPAQLIGRVSQPFAGIGDAGTARSAEPSDDARFAAFREQLLREVDAIHRRAAREIAATAARLIAAAAQSPHEESRA